MDKILKFKNYFLIILFALLFTGCVDYDDDDFVNDENYQLFSFFEENPTEIKWLRASHKTDSTGLEDLIVFNNGIVGVIEGSDEDSFHAMHIYSVYETYNTGLFVEYDDYDRPVIVTSLNKIIYITYSDNGEMYIIGYNGYDVIACNDIHIPLNKPVLSTKDVVSRGKISNENKVNNIINFIEGVEGIVSLKDWFEDIPVVQRVIQIGQSGSGYIDAPSSEWQLAKDGSNILITAGITYITAPESIPIVLTYEGIKSIAKFIENKNNEARNAVSEYYLGGCQVETLDPIVGVGGTSEIGLVIGGVSTIPYRNENFPYSSPEDLNLKNTVMGILVLKEKMTNSEMLPTDFNLYTRKAEIVFQEPVSEDGKYVLKIQTEKGYRYYYRAFLMPSYEKLGRENKHIKRNSQSAATYGEVKYIDRNDTEIIAVKKTAQKGYNDRIDFTIEVGVQADKKRVSMQYLPGNGYQTLDVSWGVVLYYRNEIVQGDKGDYILKFDDSGYGAVKINFTALDYQLESDVENFSATTRKDWAVGTYMDLSTEEYGTTYSRRIYNHDLTSVDIVYDEEPEITFIDCSFGGIGKPTSDDYEGKYDTYSKFNWILNVKGCFFMYEVFDCNDRNHDFEWNWILNSGDSDNLEQGNLIFYNKGLKKSDSFYWYKMVLKNGSEKMSSNAVKYIYDGTYFNDIAIVGS